MVSGFVMYKEIWQVGFEKGRIYSPVVLNIQEPFWQLNQQQRLMVSGGCIGKYRPMQLSFRERLGSDTAVGLGFKG